jgi:hypothetical protein
MYRIGEAMKSGLFLVMLIFAALLGGCDAPVGDYVPVSAVSRNGFARDAASVGRLEGQAIKLWGYVDHANLYGDDGAREILGEWWSGPGPSAAAWRFNLKARAEDGAGQSFAVHVPNDAKRDELLRIFRADAEAGRPTRVFVTGRLAIFDAPTNAADRTGLVLEMESSQDILLTPPAEPGRS